MRREPAGGELRFRPERRGGGLGRVAPLLILAVLAGVLLLGRALWPSAPPPGVLVEVRGEVPRPGWHRIDPPTVRAALEAAGVSGEGSAAPLHEGDRLRRTSDGLTVQPAGNPLLVALPVDVNEAGVEALTAVPGLGETLARSIVEDRQQRGPFYAVRDLARVRGLGASTVQTLAPLLTVGDVGPRPDPRPIDPNTASAATLERLPGIGPVLAARIVVDRAERGPYATVDDLDRVEGIGPATLEALRERLVIAPASSDPPRP